jgi:hypothetical protein
VQPAVHDKTTIPKLWFRLSLALAEARALRLSMILWTNLWSPLGSLDSSEHHLSSDAAG